MTDLDIIGLILGRPYVQLELATRSCDAYKAETDAIKDEYNMLQNYCIQLENDIKEADERYERLETVKRNNSAMLSNVMKENTRLRRRVAELESMIELRNKE